MLIMVLDDRTELNNVLKAWDNAGIRGVTILESTGLNRVMPRQKAHSSMVGFSQLFGSQRIGHNTIFAVIDSLEMADKAAEVTQAIVGDLFDANTGVMFVLPVVKSWGIKIEN